MEFNEKLQELRKRRNLTQEELAEAIFVSRTAVSKWESARGYPSIESLKQLSEFFGVTVDELIRPEEIMLAAEKEKTDCIFKYAALICSLLDILVCAILLLLPVFTNRTDPLAVTLFRLSDMQDWIRILFLALILFTALNGIFGVFLGKTERQERIRHTVTAGIVLFVLSCAVFILTRQPNAGMVCFTSLIIKGILLVRTRLRF